MRNTQIFSWTLQLYGALVFGFSGVSKILSMPYGAYLIDQAGVDPLGLSLLGIFELLIAGLLLTPTFPHFGAALGIAIVLGGLLEHIMVLNQLIANGAGMMIAMSVITLSAMLYVIYLHRNKLKK